MQPRCAHLNRGRADSERLMSKLSASTVAAGQHTHSLHALGAAAMQQPCPALLGSARLPHASAPHASMPPCEMESAAGAGTDTAARLIRVSR